METVLARPTHQNQKPARKQGGRRAAPLRVESVYLGTTPDTLRRQVAALKIVLGS